MFRYKLRTLLIALALAPLLLWGAWVLWQQALRPRSDMFIHDSYLEIETDQGTNRIPVEPTR
jgi:hypothetical protein